MRYRSALNRCWATVSLLWIGWCLFWPFYARRQDLLAIQAETAETYNICLREKGMTVKTCSIDRQAYTNLDMQIAWPPDQNAYQAFAGRRLPDALAFFVLLTLFPVVCGYMVVRTVLEACLWFARARPQDAATTR